MTAGHTNDTLTLEIVCISRFSAQASNGWSEQLVTSQVRCRTQWFWGTAECRRHVDHIRVRHTNTRSAVSTTRSNQVDVETAIQERYKAPISVLPSIELDVPTATSNTHAATVLPSMSPEPSTIESDDDVTGTSEKAVSGLSPHSTDMLGATTPARKFGRRRLAPAWQADYVVK